MSCKVVGISANGDQAHEKNISVFMKENLEPIIGDEHMVQEFPEAFEKVLESQKKWRGGERKIF